MKIPSRIRKIKVETGGDYFRKATFPKIRLQGKWLAGVGFKPSGHVLVRCELPGELRLSFIAPPTNGRRDPL